jgi:hypothetical protein
MLQLSRLLADGSFKKGEGRRASAGPVLLSRGGCRIRFVPLLHVPAASRPRALLNVLEGWSPFETSGWQLVPQPGGCLAIAFDAGRVDRTLRDAGASDRPLLCETLLREPMPDGTRLVPCIDGYEGQHWVRGALAHTRWWAHQPDGSEWAVFLRSAGVDLDAIADDAAPPLVEPAWLPRPFAKPRAAEAFGSATARWERLIVTACAVTLAVLSGAQARQAHDAWRALEASREELDSLTTAARPVSALRQRVEAESAQLARVSAQMSGPRPIEVLAHLAEVLPAKGVSLREFELNGLRVRMELVLDPTVSRSTVIASLQRSPWFVDIFELRDAQNRTGVPFEFKLRQAERAEGAPIPVAAAASGAPAGAAGATPAPAPAAKPARAP